jgi:hypothetical protein
MNQLHGYQSYVVQHAVRNIARPCVDPSGLKRMSCKTPRTGRGIMDGSCGLQVVQCPLLVSIYVSPTHEDFKISVP